MRINLSWAIMRRKEYLNTLSQFTGEQIGRLYTQKDKEPTQIGKELLNEIIEAKIENVAKYAKELAYYRGLRITDIDVREDSTIGDIKQHIKIETLIGSPVYVKGDNAIYFSPLRDDGRRPSFSVNTELQIWFDFVLGEGGDLITLYEKLNNCDTGQAIKELRKML